MAIYTRAVLDFRNMAIALQGRQDSKPHLTPPLVRGTQLVSQQM
jgi:hypothetical protein